ncbi:MULTISPECIES: hypothetical protein [unclassified Novosphingobium]|uniref:hypothetical protein n=1 Tax=unclassified Novosphingobium TaxID=2644732 RepID=UPI000D4FBAD0|nr:MULTISPECIES: hypothetical protein [unclassified Novosphingobium]PTR11795.1 hypothetical protein C8K11_104154 [Novosphingobium sp. GV055]PUB04835.1 hypothetical protein C8K12_104154 [Novosphingobium sp. GV061]PUB21154.1 hypothetical protein C8K14_104154 [Novosphingobium sp. GV079]PUB42880.1 hypothetical protein C8K10_104154 [Novosphingobium sp. GV027]
MKIAGLIINLIAIALLTLALTIVMLADGEATAKRNGCTPPTDAVQLIQWHGCGR